MDAKVDEVKERKKLNSLFLVACERGLFDDVKELIHRGADLNAKDSSGRSALHLAAARGRMEVVQYLWSKALDLENEDKDGKTPLHLASANGHADIVEFLIKKGALIDSIDGSSSTALHMAACRGQDEVVRVLLHYDANVGSVNDVGLTPLGIAMMSGQLDCVKMLQPSHVPIPAEGKKTAYTPLHVACLCGKSDVFDTVFKESNGNSISNNSNPTQSTPLHCAAFSGNIEIIRKILHHGGVKLRELKDIQDSMPSDCVPRGCNDYVEIRELLETRGHQRNRGAAQQDGHDSLPEIVFHRLSPGEKKTKVKRWMMMHPQDPGLLKAINDFQKASEIKIVLEKARKMDTMIKIHNAYAHIRSDKDFQEDMQDPEIRKTVELLRQDTSQYEYYSSQPRIGSVLKKLQSLHGDLKSLGEKSLMLDLALVKDVKAAVSKDESRREDLQKRLDSHLREIDNLCQVGLEIKSNEIRMKNNNDTIEHKPIQWKALLIRNIFLLALITIIGLVLKHRQVPYFL
ncbi:hypothetical protein M9434_002385 [Picochlorum sp. BPE23]|nr:hypothetical protein M9434_002385 [Picochlorum sp. BPE23]